VIALIWAQARDAAGRPVIGVAGTIPWRIPEDFARFKQLTSGHPVVMGRLTWDSLPRRPLPGRTNVVITRHAGWAPDRGDDGVAVATSLAEGLALAATAPGGEQVWVIGGGQVYREVLDAGLADRLEVTDVDLEVEGDAFAPLVDPSRWRLADESEWATSSGPGLRRYRFRTYDAR
jgi:dihydrofolate reductase